MPADELERSGRGEAPLSDSCTFGKPGIVADQRSNPSAVATVGSVGIESACSRGDPGTAPRPCRGSSRSPRNPFSAARFAIFRVIDGRVGHGMSSGERQTLSGIFTAASPAGTRA